MDSSGKGSGWINLNSVLVQWGEGTTPVTVTYPVAYTTTPKVIACRADGGGYEYSIVVGTISKTSVYLDSRGYNNSQQKNKTFWLAIGY